MARLQPPNEVRLGAQGRLVIPAHLRKALELEPGERLLARREGERIVLERRSSLVKRLQERFAHISKEVCLADEVIAERRAEAEREMGS